MRTAKVQASLRIRAVSPEPPLLAYTSRESRGTFRQKARSLAPLNGWACAVEICHDGMLEDTNSLDAAQLRRRGKDNDIPLRLLTGFDGPHTSPIICAGASATVVWSECSMIVKFTGALHIKCEDSCTKM